MNELFFVDWPIIIVLSAISLVATLQTLRYARANRLLLASLQIPCALLLAFALLLRDDADQKTLVVLTAGADASQLPAQAVAYVALPGAPTPQSDQNTRVERAPDLATALRRHPGVKHVHVIGSGLETHDREALGRRDLSFASGAKKSNGAPTIITLQPPKIVVAGQWWHVSGRVSSAKVSIELRDPSGEATASAPTDESGRFRLKAIARASGPVIYTLHLLDAEGVEAADTSSLPLPINAISAKPLRALLIAAVPTPELKFLRRWASDAGIELDSRIGLAPGLVQGKAGFTLDVAMLEQLDLLIIDERSWPSIARHRDDLRTAVRNGLGLLIRVTGPVPNNVLGEWKSLGVTLTEIAKEPSDISLTDMLKGDANGTLHAWLFNSAAMVSSIPPEVDKDRPQPLSLLTSASGQTITTQHLLGQGRIGVSGLLDSFRLYTRGERERHATLWSRVFQQTARARGEMQVELPTQAIVGQRTVLCGLTETTKLIAPDQTEIPLILDPSSADCAAFWPRVEGWYHVHRNDIDLGAENRTPAPEDDSPSSLGNTRVAQAFYVFDPATITGLLDTQRQAATAALVNQAEPLTETHGDTERWRRLALLAWLILMIASWWLERRIRRMGLVKTAAVAQ